MYALIENGAVKQYPYTTGDLKRANPQTSFPSEISDASLLEYGVHRVFFATQPELTATQVLEEGTPVFADGRWTQTFTVRDMTAEEVSSRDGAQAAAVRAERDAKLAACDWRVIKALESNTPQDFAWAEYRQALRDVTAQTGFPWTVNWPVTP
jgi:hypothetical protein